MPNSPDAALIPGAKITVTQQIPVGSKVWCTQVSGAVVSFEQRCTGSWFAHSKNDRLWLDRLTLRKSDGELAVLNLDEFSRIEMDGEKRETASAAQIQTASGDQKT